MRDAMTSTTTTPHALADSEADVHLDAKLLELEESLGSMKRALVAYSGGVDSAMLAVAAHRVLGDHAMAVTADSESYARGELEAAITIARQFGIPHRVVHTRELDNPDYASNPINRCYFCKHELFTHMRDIAVEEGVDYVLYGQNADDVGDFRPGAQAATEFGVRAPLQEAGMTKAEVRALARRWGIPVWDRPATACLSSRFPYGTPVTAHGLRMIDEAERMLRAHGFTQLRVRHHDHIARIELAPEEMPRILSDEALRNTIAGELAGLGYRLTVLDLRGFRSGSLNEVLVGGDVPADVLSAAAAEPHACVDDVEPLVETRHGQILVVQMANAQVGRLTDPEHRARFVQRSVAAPDVHYLALQLSKPA